MDVLLFWGLQGEVGADKKSLLGVFREVCQYGDFLTISVVEYLCPETLIGSNLANSDLLMFNRQLEQKSALRLSLRKGFTKQTITENKSEVDSSDYL